MHLLAKFSNLSKDAKTPRGERVRVSGLPSHRMMRPAAAGRPGSTRHEPRDRTKDLTKTCERGSSWVVRGSRTRPTKPGAERDVRPIKWRSRKQLPSESFASWRLCVRSEALQHLVRHP
jgi:hypothetical protein